MPRCAQLLDVDIEGAGEVEWLALQLACAGEPTPARPASVPLQVAARPITGRAVNYLHTCGHLIYSFGRCLSTGC
jgi:hypothetical protein